MYYQLPPDIMPEEILEYLRKSRSDDPTLTVEEVLEKHEKQLDDWAERNFGRPIPEENKFREVVSGETIDSRPELLAILKKKAPSRKRKTTKSKSTKRKSTKRKSTKKKGASSKSTPVSKRRRVKAKRKIKLL